ncbi:hypothetical protein AVEN_71111-1 [Araneus ventricosus]|uniref:Uncharacterized protein n=1 Tax=Araneus ventricosus TaxID=182803 RepID=A0A4Y2HJ69_ARAVE|nr:hypothetical protein AVEN_71111-1 [Araneus ventricosus]
MESHEFRYSRVIEYANVMLGIEVLTIPHMGPLWHDPCKSYENIWTSTAPPTIESNKERQLPALETPSLGTYLGASRDLYVQIHLKERSPALKPSPGE